ncbi:MAG: hypothetical protein F6K10_32400 [Moorea sp. SIO2B7]|nr:hypothetical protein [Moorena sp. SIO2B7]
MIYPKTLELYVVVAISALLVGASTQAALGNSPLPYQESNGTENLLTQNSQQRREWDAFFSSKYDYWDAKVLAEYWEQSIGDAKARIGRKILWGETDIAILEQFLVDARIQALQSVNDPRYYRDSEYKYKDAQALAKFWGEPSPWEAKLRIEKNLRLGNDEIVKEALLLARPNR